MGHGVRMIAVITGANRGIGLEVARRLAQRGDTAILTARDLTQAQAVAERVGARAAQLDVTDASSAQRLAAELEAVDVLVNNAAINYDTWQRATTADLDQVRETLETNLLGAWRTTQALLPQLQRSAHPRIVNVSSGSGQLSDMGGGTPAYRVGKTALNALTRMLAAELPRARVNSVCPGWVATDMGGAGGRPVSEGAASVIWAIDVPDDGPTGGFFRDGRPLPW
jgi:NAD(P)-dependent dehydrogenase (short-subunit alcohol dehydrogenase family)